MSKNDSNFTLLYTYWDAVFQKSLVQMTLGKREHNSTNSPLQALQI